jgi:hypothetical protein
MFRIFLLRAAGMRFQGTLIAHALRATRNPSTKNGCAVCAAGRAIPDVRSGKATRQYVAALSVGGRDLGVPATIPIEPLR